MNTINDLSRILVEMRSMASAAQGTPAAGQANGAGDFGAILRQSIDKVNDLQQHADGLAASFERGVAGVDLADVMIAQQKGSVAFQALMQVRNKVVTAYQEVMSMPV